MLERWLPVPSWEHRYEASTEGRVRSLDIEVQMHRGGSYVRRGQVLKPIAKGGRYWAVTLADGERRQQIFIHDIIAATFIGPKPPGLHTLHKHDDKTDNRARHLRYGTVLDNEADRKANGRIAQGSRHGMAKLTEGEVLIIRADMTAQQAANRYGICYAHAWNILARKTWRHI